MMQRPAAVIADAARSAERAHERRMSERWAAAVDERYRGRKIAEARNGWSDRLSRGDVIKLERYLADPAAGALLLQGPTGTGKSTLAVTVATYLVNRDHLGAAMVSSVVLLDRFSFDREGRPLEEYGDAGVLIIDDLGSVNEGITGHQRRMLWALIERRWAAKRITILTTNMAIADQSGSGAGLATWVGPSGWDRLADGMTRLVLRGDSFRTS